MALPTKVVLALPMHEDGFSKIKNLAEKSQAVVLEITRSIYDVGFKYKGEWLSACHPMYHVHQALQWPNLWERIYWKWPRKTGEEEFVHANDIVTTLNLVGSTLKSLKLENVTIDGTMTDIKNLATAIKHHTRFGVLESIEFKAVYGADERARDLLPTLIPSLAVRSIGIHFCDWATSHLGSLPFTVLNQLDIRRITPAELKPVLEELCDKGSVLKALTIRFLHFDECGGKDPQEEFVNRVAGVLLQNKTLEQLSFPIMHLGHTFPVLKALESTNRTLKDINFRLLGLSSHPVRNPTKQQLEELKTNAMTVLTTNTAIEHIRFSDYKGDPVDYFWPLTEVEYYLKLNREGMRSELLEGYGENDQKWWDTLVRNKDNGDISFSFLLLTNNFRAFFGNTPANEGHLVASFLAKRKRDKDNENDNIGSDSPDKKRQRVQAVNS
jgi:hypothetical protein